MNSRTLTIPEKMQVTHWHCLLNEDWKGPKPKADFFAEEAMFWDDVSYLFEGGYSILKVCRSNPISGYSRTNSPTTIEIVQGVVQTGPHQTRTISTSQQVVARWFVL